MDTFFKPNSIAVIGVSEKPTNMARNIIANLHEFSYDGIIYAVGQRGGKIFGRRIYRSVADIPDQIDLAVILTPADTVPDIIEECGQKGIRHAVIESAGFREFGEVGKRREENLLKVTKKHKIRFIGPNGIGLINLNKGMVLPFIALKDVLPRGRVSIVSQSGGVGVSLLNALTSESIGMSKFASIGNKLNIDENDLIEYLLKDDETDIIIAYIEGISDGRRLMQLAASAVKPILIHKANIGVLGKAIAESHTAALSSDDAVVDAAFKQCGIARFEETHTLIDYLKILPLPKIKGHNLAIISRSGGHAILAADAAEQSGFQLAPFNPSFIKEIESHFRANVIQLTNPLDLGDLFDYEVYVKIIEMTIKQDNVDGVVFLHTYLSTTEGEASRMLIKKAHELSNKYNKPIGVCVATDEEEIYKLRKDLKQPIFTSPSEIIRALALVSDFDYDIKSRPKKPAIKAARNRVKTILESCKKQKRSPLLQEGLEIFSAYNIPVVQSKWVTTEKEAVEAANKLGYPVVLKIVSSEISHKTDIGGVELNIKNARHVKEAYEEMNGAIRKKMPKAKIEGVVIQPMLKHGPEIILGAKRDPNFGPVVLVGLGGIFVEIFKDTSMRVVPFFEKEAEKMLTELKGYPLLTGARGGKTFDIKAITKSIIQLAALIDDFDIIKEIDINPFCVLKEGEGGMALDARIIIR